MKDCLAAIALGGYFLGMTDLRKLKIGGLFVAFLALTAIGFAVHDYLRPSWTERYSIAGDSLHVTDGSGRPLAGALVVRIAAVGAIGGGWDTHSIHIPPPGTRPWVELAGADWHLGAGLTDAAGAISEPPFDGVCVGSQGGLGCRQNDALFAVVVYRRGYVTAVVAPGVYLPADDHLGLFPVDYNANVDWNRLRSIGRLLEPALEPTQIWQDAYRNAPLPDGRSDTKFCEDELDWLCDHSTDRFATREADRLSRALKRGDLKDGSPEATVLIPG